MQFPIKKNEKDADSCGHLEPKKKHMEGVSELLTAAELYMLKEPVLNHLKQVISDNICCGEHCIVCFNNWIFSEQHGLDAPQKHRTFYGDTLDTWRDALGPDRSRTLAKELGQHVKVMIVDKILNKSD